MTPSLMRMSIRSMVVLSHTLVGLAQPQFSPSGRRVAWIGERLDLRTKADSYWATPKDEPKRKAGAEPAAQDGVEGEASTRAAGSLERHSMRRDLGEMVGVSGSVLVYWDWQTNHVTVRVLPRTS